MKKLLTLLTLIMLLNVCYAQPLKFEEVIQFEGKSKTDLTNKSKVWIAQKFTPNAENYSEDAEVGILIVKSFFDYKYEREYKPFKMEYKSAGQVHYTIMIEIKEGRVKYSMIDMTHIGLNEMFNSFGLLIEGDFQGKVPKWKNNTWADVKKQASEEFNLMKNFYIQQINTQGDNDW